jgi:anti-sigma regulatory factor (Ser/Thr protein kinase)
MKTKELILKLVREKKSVRTVDIVAKTHITRQSANEHLRNLVERGVLIKAGSTKNATYLLAQGNDKVDSFNKLSHEIRHTFTRVGLDETRVLKTIVLETNMRQALSKNAFNIFSYAFSEMVNNAIEHSRSAKIHVAFAYHNSSFSFEAKDEGIGVYESIRSKFKLLNHFESVEHLLKGKQTTAPEGHSGQGIFFTSKIADVFVLESEKIRLTVDSALNDVMVESVPFVKGTRVFFQLKRKTRKQLEALFREYSNADFEFDKTKITVHLSKREGEHISRSQARRILFGLEKFKRVVLDFKNVAGVGQGFADEIFRVFKNAHPEISFEIVNANESVTFMVERAKRETRSATNQNTNNHE